MNSFYATCSHTQGLCTKGINILRQRRFKTNSTDSNLLTRFSAFLSFSPKLFTFPQLPHFETILLIFNTMYLFSHIPQHIEGRTVAMWGGGTFQSHTLAPNCTSLADFVGLGAVLCPKGTFAVTG